ncbi:MAG TPA: serine hydrolase [Gemmatimonadaceae bacterium]|nr:serine hydrolase [Gemmatimonadaceae bacterium]
MLPAVIAVLLVLGGGEGLPVKSPASVGMSAKRLETIDRVINRGIRAGGFPGASVVVGRQGAAVWEKGFGRIDWSQKSPAVTARETVFDLASLTKVVGTTTAIMILFDEGRIDLDAPVSTYLPEFSGGYKDSVTIRHLLEHRSGLPADRDLWRIAHSPEEARDAVLATPLECKPGDCYIYSDLGAITLGMVVERVTGEGLDVFLRERVFGPLGMENTFFRPADSIRRRVAPTEVTPPRGYPLQGEVHDENAYALGGVAGHAGLFSTASDLSIFAQMILNGGEYDGVRIVSDSTVRLFTHRAAGSRALGWAMADGQWGSGKFLTDGSFGHVGYTGTSIWIDPERQMFVVLLTNRVHAARARRPAKVIADIRADLTDAAAVAVTDNPDLQLAMPASFRSDHARGWNHAEHRHRKRHHASASSSKKKSTSSKAKKSKKYASTK